MKSKRHLKKRQTQRRLEKEAQRKKRKQRDFLEKVKNSETVLGWIERHREGLTEGLFKEGFTRSNLIQIDRYSQKHLFPWVDKHSKNTNRSRLRSTATFTAFIREGRRLTRVVFDLDVENTLETSLKFWNDFQRIEKADAVCLLATIYEATEHKVFAQWDFGEGAIEKLADVLEYSLFLAGLLPTMDRPGNQEFHNAAK